MSKKIVLTKEEQELIRADEQGLLKPLPNIEELREKYAAIARNTMRKNKTITIRISEKDLNKIKAKALAEGMPYQTLIGSLIHKYALE